MQGQIQREFEGSAEPFLDSKFHFHDKFGTLFLILLFNKPILLPVNVCRIAWLVASSVNPDQTPHSAASNLGLHCLLRAVCLNM